jgi:uncharacterized protein (UPF0276 family)
LRHEHAQAWLAGVPGAGFVEIHAENYMMAGGPALSLLDRIAERYPVSVHGVALSLAGEDRPDRAHLAALKRLIDRIAPAAFSEHLAWSSHDGIYLNDLLPVPYTAATLSRLVDHIDETQSALGMPLLLENPSTYVAFEESDWDEVDFLSEITRRSGCGLLLDVNNVAVSAANHGFEASAYVDRFPLDRVGEIHIAGHDVKSDGLGRRVLIDGHGSPVDQSVWDLLARVLERGGRRPILIERDNAVPPIEDLYPEIERASRLLAHLRCEVPA